MARLYLGLLLLFLVLPALGASWLAPYDPQAIDLAGSLSAPSAAHPLGQDEHGSDVLSRLIYGARVSLLVSIVSVLASVLVGLLVGLCAGWCGGWIEEALMRLVDVFLAFPGLLLTIALAAMLGPGLENVLLALSLLGWPGFARLVRAETRSLLQAKYVLASRALGARPTELICWHVLPNMMAPLLVQASFAMAGAILAEASLSFLGLGLPPGTPSWGAMLAEGKQALFEAPHLSLFPGLAIVFTVLTLNLLGDALSNLNDPRRREN